MTNVEYLRNNFPLLKNKYNNSIIMLIDRIGYSVCPTFGRPPSCHECGSCYDMFLERKVDYIVVGTFTILDSFFYYNCYFINYFYFKYYWNG